MIKPEEKGKEKGVLCGQRREPMNTLLGFPHKTHLLLYKNL